jgi:hypothetical protein
MVTVLYVGIMATGLSRSFLYGGGFVGAFPLLLAFFLGPWLVAWIACKVLPSDRNWLIVRLALGNFAGAIAGLWVVPALAAALLPEWTAGDPRARFVARHEASLALIPFFVCIFASVLAASCWRRQPAQ